VPGRVPAPVVTANDPVPVHGRPVSEFLPVFGFRRTVGSAGATASSDRAGKTVVFPLSAGLTVFPLSIGLLVFCASAVVMLVFRTRTLRLISSTRFVLMADPQWIAQNPQRGCNTKRFLRLPEGYFRKAPGGKHGKHNLRKGGHCASDPVASGCASFGIAVSRPNLSA